MIRFDSWTWSYLNFEITSVIWSKQISYLDLYQNVLSRRQIKFSTEIRPKKGSPDQPSVQSWQTNTIARWGHSWTCAPTVTCENANRFHTIKYRRWWTLNRNLDDTLEGDFFVFLCLARPEDHAHDNLPQSEHQKTDATATRRKVRYLLGGGDGDEEAHA